jgi:hypothetical protein
MDNNKNLELNDTLHGNILITWSFNEIYCMIFETQLNNDCYLQIMNGESMLNIF